MTINQVLQYVRSIAPTAAITGGYLRDKFFGVQPKDVDIFVPHGTTIESLQKLFPEARAETFDGAMECLTAGEVVGAIQLTNAEGLPVQVIVLAPGFDPLERSRTHDFGFCQIALQDSSAGLTYTQAFETDSVNNTATLVSCENQQEFDRSLRRWERLKLKYPTRTLVIPEEFQQYLKEAA